MHEPITVEVDRGHGDGARRSNPITFIGRLLETVEGGRTTMRLYEWADRGRLVYLVHVEEGKPGQPPRHTLYPFVNTRSAGAAPRKVTPPRRFLGPTRSSPTGGSGGRRAARGPSGLSPRRSP
ncbi:MAG TPA: hypothetical protein VGV91_09725 [Rubrobacter sp.]|nr:hypothetical protein [Rubrobacter sp.]